MIRAEIDLGAIRHNVRVLRQLAGDADLMGVVKADAYGHGAVFVARALVEEGVDALAVATVGEAQGLREAGIEAEILVFSAPLPEQLPLYAQHDLRVTVSSAHVARFVADAARQHGPLTIHVKVDTGMHRLGLAPGEVAHVVRQLGETPGVLVEGLWTHLATADEPTTEFVTEQVRRFQSVVDELCADTPPVVHVANGPALLRGLVLAQSNMRVRVGGILYGLASSPSLQRDVEAAGLRPAMRLVSRVVHLQTVDVGESVSYGRTWTAERPTRVATVAAGYADGLLRAYKGPVGVGEGRYPVVGRVCMDMMLIDLGDPEGPGASVAVGDEATLFGAGGVSAVDAAATAGTLSYELTSGLTARVPRIEVG
ncbi:MAG: alanine racemase [Rubricoccaceae bacterium]